MKKLTSLLCVFILALSICSITAFAENVIPEERQIPRLTDAADVLSNSEETTLLSKLDKISEQQKCDVAVMTVSDLPDGYSSAKAFADDSYDYYGFGMGSDNDGMLLVLVMNSHDWYISTHGYGVTAITDAGLEYMSGKFLPYLSKGDYAQGFTQYADLCDDFITQANAGTPYDVKNLPKNIKWLEWIGISLAVGLLAAFGFVSFMKGKMKSVDYQKTAGSYLREGSLNIEESRDIFLYSTVSKTAKPKESDNSNGGSSTHISSSGESHGGGGGKF